MAHFWTYPTMEVIHFVKIMIEKKNDYCVRFDGSKQRFFMKFAHCACTYTVFQTFRGRQWLIKLPKYRCEKSNIPSIIDLMYIVPFNVTQIQTHWIFAPIANSHCSKFHNKTHISSHFGHFCGSLWQPVIMLTGNIAIHIAIWPHDSHCYMI